MLCLPADYDPGNWGELQSSLIISNPVEQGAQAYFDGRDVRDNPHPIPSRRADGWNSGYMQTQQEVEGTEFIWGGCGI